MKPATSSGRATKGTAETLLASVYLYQKKYDQAIPLLESVTKEGYGLLGEYADVFKTSNKNIKHDGLNVLTPDLLRSYEAGDKRVEASVGAVEGHIQDDDFISDRQVFPTTMCASSI